MDRAVVFTPRAEGQLDELYARIAADRGAEVADAYVQRIVASCRALAAFPSRGTRRDDLRPGLRIVGFERRITIAFSFGTAAIVVHGIFYGGQDFAARLDDDS